MFSSISSPGHNGLAGIWTVRRTGEPGRLASVLAPEVSCQVRLTQAVRELPEHPVRQAVGSRSADTDDWVGEKRQDAVKGEPTCPTSSRITPLVGQALRLLLPRAIGNTQEICTPQLRVMSPGQLEQNERKP